VDIIGLDPSVEEGMPKEFVRGVVQDMPFEEQSFDSIISISLFDGGYFERHNRSLGSYLPVAREIRSSRRSRPERPSRPPPCSGIRA